MSDDGLTLERFLRELPALDSEQLLAISAAHERARGEALERARETAADLARETGLLEELRQLQGTIVQWAGGPLANSRRYTGEAYLDNRVLGDLREQARPALLDAAAALFLVERLPHDARDVLLGPVESVLG